MARKRSQAAPREPSIPARRSRHWPAWLGAVLALTFAVYLPSLDNGFTNWDDNFYVTENPLLAHPDARAVLTTPVAGNYHPLTIASLALNYRISKLDPASYHWLSLLLHVANTALVFVFIRRLSQGRLWTTVVTSLFFGIHPMHVESVAWVAERKDVLYAFFYLLGLVAYLRHVDRGPILWLALSWVAFVLSVASKPAAVVFPITLLLIDYFRGRPFKLPVLLEKAPFFAVALVAGILTLNAQQSAGAISAVWSPFQKLLFACYATVMYVVKLLFPIGLSAIYPYPSPVTGPGAHFYVAFAAAILLVPAAVYLSRRHRAIGFGLAFFFINIVLVLQFFTLGGATMADRYTYVSYIGLLFALAWWLDEPRSGAVRTLKHVLAALVVLQIHWFLFLTWKRCEVWHSSETLWNDTIAKYPGQIADAYINRGYHYYADAKRFDLALADFNRALALNSRSQRIWFNRGLALAALAQYDSAQTSFERAVALDPQDADAVNNLGAAKLERGDFAAAAGDFSRAIELKPRYRDAYRNRSLAYKGMGDYARAVEDGRRFIELDPNHPDNYAQFGSIGFALQQLNRAREAIAAYDEAIRRAPAADPVVGRYYLNRSIAWRALGDRDRALADAREAMRRNAQVPAGYLPELGASR